MKNILRRGLWLGGFLALTLGLAPSTANAQLRSAWPGRPPSATYYNPYAQVPWRTLPQPQIPINPNWWVGPGLTVRQAAYNQAMMNYGTFANTPFQWYNPFINQVNYAPFYGFNPYMNPYFNAYNPYAGYGYGGVYMNPYAFIYGGY